MKKKCKVMHIGYRNEKTKCILNGVQLKSVDSQVDLGVTFDRVFLRLFYSIIILL